MTTTAIHRGDLMAARDETITARPYVAAPPRAERLPVPGRLAIERVARAGAQAGLLALMVAGGVAMVTAIPVGWLWLASQYTDSFQSVSGGLALLVLGGITISTAIGAKLLAHAGARYERMRGVRPRSVPDGWRRSLRDGRGSAHPVSALDVIMTVIAAGAVIALFAYIGLDLIGIDLTGATLRAQ
jgi:hypothetical protein